MNKNTDTLSSIVHKKETFINDMAGNIITKLKDEYTKPKETQDETSVMIWSDFIYRIHDLESNPNKLKEVYSFCTDEFEKYISEHYEKYNKIIPLNEDFVTQKQTPQRMVLKQVKNVVVAILMIFGLIFSAQVVLYAFEIDLFGIVAEWGKAILNI